MRLRVGLTTVRKVERRWVADHDNSCISCDVCSWFGEFGLDLYRLVALE
jgi:hypothetical protein